MFYATFYDDDDGAADDDDDDDVHDSEKLKCRLFQWIFRACQLCRVRSAEGGCT